MAIEMTDSRYDLRTDDRRVQLLRIEMDDGDFEERLFRHIMATMDVSEETGRTLSAAAFALYQRIGDVIHPSPVTDIIDSVSLTDALRTLHLGSLADRLERVVLRERLAARAAAFDRLRDEPDTDTVDQYAFTSLILENAQSTVLKRLPQPRRRATKARRPCRRRRRGVAVRITTKPLFERSNRLSMNDLDWRVRKLERGLI
jgi:hypothetical protein